MLPGQGDPNVTPLTPATAVTAWELNPWVLLPLIVIAAVYLCGVARLHRRGDQWPVGRTLTFVFLGLGSIAVATMSSLGVYDGTLFWVHMVQHMVLQMVAPVFLALGAPLTLALRTLPSAPRRLLRDALHSRVAQFLAFPPVGATAFVVVPFALYFSGWYEATLRSGPLHESQHFLFVTLGAMFMWPLIGIDPIPNRAPFPLRILTTFLVLPGHVFLGVTMMQSSTLLAGDYYRELGRTWGPALAADQNIAGGLIWVAGDIIGLLMLGILIVQWIRSDERDAIRIDRHLDRTAGRPDDALVAYNEMLGRLAAREPR
jgi:putative copper resistance protein D